ncbi:MAG: agmatinase [Thermoguttaceae bacterium]
MIPADSTQFLGLPAPDPQQADALVLPAPIEKTVSYGTGTAGGPRAILEASFQLEPFDEETLVDFTEAPRVHTLAPLSDHGDIETCLARLRDHVRPLRDRFVLTLGGEHTITYGLVEGLVEDLSNVTIVQIDAHADLADKLHGQHWSHGTVMRRLWQRGCSLLQIGIRSLTRDEHDVATAGPRITTFYAHSLKDQWADLLDALLQLEGNVYLTIDVDGLDPAVIPSTGTPQPNGLSWRQMMDILRVLLTESRARVLGADVVEFVPSPVGPGCDPTAARLAAKLLAWRWLGRR